MNDINDAELRFLSVDRHPYFGGATRIHGTVAVEGPVEDALVEVVLEVVEDGVVVATAHLAAAANDVLLQPFGGDGQVQVSTSQLLFELPSTGLEPVDQMKNGIVTLRARARSVNGYEATSEFGNVSKLVRYHGMNRYGGRELGRGGDDWVKPTVRTTLEYFTEHGDGLVIGDISDMNGGPFPPHESHQMGVDVDAWFPGYDSLDAATAERLLSYLNDLTHGWRIRFIFVTFERSDNDPFWNAIKGVRLADGRQAPAVIRPLPGHDTHFHMRFLHY